MGQDITMLDGFGAPAAALAGFDAAEASDELGGGIVGSFAVLGYRGKVWRVRYRGEENNVVNEETGDPVASIELVLIKSAPHLSKVYYPGGFNEDAAEKPTCWSNDSVNPDRAVPEPVHTVCATCPMNSIGSRVTDNGKAAKACSDHKRVAVVPLKDLGNELFGGPMLLRVPAASLGELKTYADLLKQHGFIYFGAGTRIRFDIDEAYPKLKFSPVRPLSNEEAEYVLSLRDDPKVARILNEQIEPLEPSGSIFEQPPENSAPAPQRPAPASAPQRPAPAPAPQRPAPAPQRPAPAPVARTVSPMGAAIARPVARPVARAATAAPVVAEPEPELPLEEATSAGSDLDAELDALLET